MRMRKAIGWGLAGTPPMADCNGRASDGGEVDPSTDSDHCGACQPACLGGDGDDEDAQEGPAELEEGPAVPDARRVGTEGHPEGRHRNNFV